MARRFARSTKFARADRQSIWVGIDISLVTVGANTKILAGTFNTATLENRPFTIVRTRAALQIESDQTAASEVTRGAVGMTVVSDQAVAAGIASIPGPHDNTDGEWFVWEPFINSFALGDATGFVEPAGTNITIDSKAMRKVNANDDLAVVFEVQGTPGAIITMQGRMLIKLH